MQRKQTTSSEGEGWPLEGGVEPQDKAEALSISAASTRGRNDVGEVEEAMLEKILSRDNLNLAYKKVKSNRGSPGIDGMTVEELLPSLNSKAKL